VSRGVSQSTTHATARASAFGTGVAFRIFAIGALLGCALLLPAASAADEIALDRFDTVVIDAGHGGEDTGAHGVRGLVEKDLVLDVSRRLAARLRERSLRVVMTRDGDRFVPL